MCALSLPEGEAQFRMRAAIKKTVGRMHERCWEVLDRPYCSVVGCVTDWQQETRSLFIAPPPGHAESRSGKTE